MTEARLGRLVNAVRRQFRAQEVSIADFSSEPNALKGRKVVLHGYAKLVNRGQVEVIPSVWQGIPVVQQHVTWDIYEQANAQSPKIVASGTMPVTKGIPTFDNFQEVRVIGKVAVSKNQRALFVKVTKVEKVKSAA